MKPQFSKTEKELIELINRTPRFTYAVFAIAFVTEQGYSLAEAARFRAINDANQKGETKMTGTIIAFGGIGVMLALVAIMYGTLVFYANTLKDE